MKNLKSGIAKVAVRPYRYGTIIDVAGDRCTVQFSPSSRLTNIRYIGGAPAIGNDVKIEWESGEPVVKSASFVIAALSAGTDITGGGAQGTSGTESVPTGRVALLDDDNVFTISPQTIEVAVGEDATVVYRSGSNVTGGSAYVLVLTEENHGVVSYDKTHILDSDPAFPAGAPDGTPSSYCVGRIGGSQLPSDFIVTGLKVTVVLKTNLAGSVYGFDHEIVFWNGVDATISENKASLVQIGTDYETRIYGGETDMWTITGLDTATINAGSVAFACRYYRTPPGTLWLQEDVDYIGVTIYGEPGVTYVAGLDESRGVWAIESGSVLSGSGFEFHDDGHFVIPATSVAPLSVSASLLNTSLNADLLDGQHSTEFSGSSHSIEHGPGGNDLLKLDDLAAPDDNTDLDVNSGSHGLAPKLSGIATQFLNGVGGWTEPDGVSGTGSSGSLAMWTGGGVLGNVTPSTGWSVTNYVSTKSLDASAATLNEALNVIATLVDILKSLGVLGA